MGHKVYISFKTEDSDYKETIQAWEHLDYVDKSLNSPINSNDSDYILRKIREDYRLFTDEGVAVVRPGAARRCRGEGRGLPMMGVLTQPVRKTSTCLTLPSRALT